MFQSCVTVPGSFDSRVPSCDCLAHSFGNAADRPERVPVYPSDMTDAEWAVVRDAMPVPAVGGVMDECHPPRNCDNRQEAQAGIPSTYRAND